MSGGVTFLLPGLWPLLAAPLLLGCVLAWRDRERGRRLAALLGPRAPVLAAELAPRRRGVRRILAAAGGTAAILAVLQPSWGEGPAGAVFRGADLVVCLDVSRSMLAADVDPSRLEAARRAAAGLSRAVRGDRLGLVVFAGEARRKVPLTRDAASFAALVAEAGPLDVPRGGTDLGAALEQALALVGEGREGFRAVFLLTDGEDHEGRGLAAARKCAEAGVRVFCVGYGSPRGGKIPLEGADGKTSFLRDKQGREVVTAGHPEGLRRIAGAGGGRFLDGGSVPDPLALLYAESVRPRARDLARAGAYRGRANRFQWPLLAAFVLWMVELCFSDRKRGN